MNDADKTFAPRTPSDVLVDPQPGDILYDRVDVMYRRILRRIGKTRIEYEDVIEPDDPKRGVVFQCYIAPWSWQKFTKDCDVYRVSQGSADCPSPQAKECLCKFDAMCCPVHDPTGVRD